MVMKPKAEIPQALVGDGAAPAGMAAATIAPPTTASDPATLTAPAENSFTGVPFIGDVTVLCGMLGSECGSRPGAGVFLRARVRAQLGSPSRRDGPPAVTS